MAASNTGMAQPHLEDRVLGSLLGCMCGDVLGAGENGFLPVSTGAGVS